MRLTISGPPGSGKTTVANILARKYKLEVITGGLIFRRYAKEKGIDLEKLGELAEKDERIDRELDSFLLEEMKKKDNVIIESRLSGWLAKTNNIKAFKIFITADENERIRRIVESIKVREGEKLENIQETLRRREKSESERYEKYYGANYYDPEIYDIIIDSTDLNVDQVIKVIEDAMDIWEGTIRENN